MNEREFTEFAGCTISPEGSGSGRVAVNYRLWERSLRNELVKLRAVDQGLEADGFSERLTVFMAPKKLPPRR